MGEVGLLLVQLLASSCRLLVNVGRMACKLGKKRAQTHIHDGAYSGTWIVSAGESAAAACSGTAGWAGARLESANGSSWTLNTLQFHTPIANSKCRKPTQQGRLDGTQYGWNCSRYKYSRAVPARAAGTNYDSLSCSATQPVRWVHHTTRTTLACEWRTPRTVSRTRCVPVRVHPDFQERQWLLWRVRVRPRCKSTWSLSMTSRRDMPSGM